MTLGSDYAKGLALAANYGDSAADICPTTVYLAFFAGDPTAGGTEQTGTGGIPRLTLVNDGTNFAAPIGASIANVAVWVSVTSTGGWADDADHWALFDALTGGNMLDTGEIVDDSGDPATLTVAGANTVVVVPVGDWVLTQS
jgi:hypothetical protein